MAKKREDTAIYVAYDDYQGFDPAHPERNLQRAVLMTAMADIQKQGEAHELAKDFFLSEEEDYVFSFRAICNFLNVDPQQILVLTGLPVTKVPESSQARKEKQPAVKLELLPD